MQCSLEIALKNVLLQTVFTTSVYFFMFKNYAFRIQSMVLIIPDSTCMRCSRNYSFALY